MFILEKMGCFEAASKRGSGGSRSGSVILAEYDTARIVGRNCFAKN